MPSPTMPETTPPSRISTGIGIGENLWIATEV